jgi:uncharacterized protein
VNNALREEMDRKRPQLSALCEKYGVARLDIFGSGATTAWRPDESDLDFVVVFGEQPGKSMADRYLGLAEDLERLFGRRVDLLTERAIRNPYFRQAVDATRTSVYAG